MCALTLSAVYLFTPELHQIEADIFFTKTCLGLPALDAFWHSDKPVRFCWVFACFHFIYHKSHQYTLNYN